LQEQATAVDVGEVKERCPALVSVGAQLVGIAGRGKEKGEKRRLPMMMMVMMTVIMNLPRWAHRWNRVHLDPAQQIASLAALASFQLAAVDGLASQ
jgi:hypothetical protein